MNDELISLAMRLGEKLFMKRWYIATAESCTGGGLSAAITAIPGSSAWFGYGVVSYANEAKQRLLGVTEQTLEVYGAVSEAVAREMVEGILALSNADVGVAITGIAGPSGGSLEKPVGGVWLGWGMKKGGVVTTYCQFEGDRLAIQRQATVKALQGALDFLEKNTV